jgi:diguanylate cyclase (GGDEF)-like protein
MTNPERHVPARALTLSLAALAVPVLAVLLFPEWTDEQGMLIWLTSLVPAFLLAYYRGLRGVALSAAGAMALLSITQVALLITGRGAPNWYLLLGIVGIYLAVCIALAVFAEILHRERRAAEALALVDALTGLPNRRHAEVTLDAQFAAAGRGRPLAVMVYDIDHFRQINDEHGRNVGDSALRAVADVLRQKTRRMDLSARIGGEEFLSILGDCELGPAVAFANRVRTEIAAQTFPFGKLTVSVGVAAYEEGMGSYEVLLASADRALYAAKEGGRNRVEVAEITRGPKTVSYASRRPPVPEISAGGKGETVMVIDDDLTVRHAVGRMLRHAGYTVEETDDPEVVLRRYGATPMPDLLVTDVMMPKMNGLTLAGRIAQWDLKLRVIYLSGYLQKDVSWAGLPGAVAAFVAKPIEPQELLAITRGVLDRTLGTPAVTTTRINPPSAVPPQSPQ